MMSLYCIRWHRWHLDDMTPTSRSNPTSTIVGFFSGAFLPVRMTRINSQASLFSSRARKLSQFLGSGTDRPSVTRLTGRAPIESFILVLPLIDVG